MEKPNVATTGNRIINSDEKWTFNTMRQTANAAITTNSMTTGGENNQMLSRISNLEYLSACFQKRSAQESTAILILMCLLPVKASAANSFCACKAPTLSFPM